MLAIRPKTLPAAAATALVGAAAAAAEGFFRPGPALAALLGAMLLQIGANLANDVFDFYRGADAAERLGPTRVTQAGLLTPAQVKTGMWVTFGLAAVVGVYLIAVAGWPVLWMGVFSILAAIAYTGGPFPLGYYGLGDLAVFIFFGLVSVCGTYYVQTGTIGPAAVWASVPMGLLTVAILVVNNLRDIETDRRVGKHTLAVRLGVGGTRLEFAACILGAYLVLPLMWLAGQATPWVLLPLASIPVAIPLLRSVYTRQGRLLNQVLAGTGRLELVFGVLFGLGLVLGGVGFGW